MTSVSIDRINGARSSLAIKAPCVVATTAAITLSGEQTIDGIAVVTDDRVLVKNQASGVDNGIYIADTSTWERAPDADGNADWTAGTLIKVNGGTTTNGFWALTTTGTITVGTTALTFAASSSILAVVSAFMQTVLSAADATTAFNALAAAALSATGDISPTALAANTDNWAPTGFSTASTIRMDASAAWDLTGIAAGTDGRLICLHNISAFTVTLKDNATSTAANRFQLKADLQLAPDSSVLLQYDSTSSRWRAFGQPATNALLSNATAVLTAGYSATPYSAGTKSSGTFTPDEANGNFQYAINGGAHTLAPPTNNCGLLIQYTNNGSAGAVTTSGFTKVTGDSLTTTNGDDFLLDIRKINGFSHLNVTALQ